VVVNDLEHHHQDDTKVRSTKEPEDPELPQVYDYEDDKKEMGAPCFTHRVRTMPVPKGFKLPHDQQKIRWILGTTIMALGLSTSSKKYWEEPRKQQCKVCNYTSPAQQGHG
jgi:hypothetical protein